MLIGLICAVALAWLIQSLAYRKSWDRGLEVKTAFADSWAYEGETGSLRKRWSMTNGCLFQLWKCAWR